MSDKDHLGFEKAVLEDLIRAGVLVRNESTDSIYVDVRLHGDLLFRGRDVAELLLLAVVAVSNLRAMSGYDIDDDVPKTALPEGLL